MSFFDPTKRTTSISLKSLFLFFFFLSQLRNNYIVHSLHSLSSYNQGLFLSLSRINMLLQIGPKYNIKSSSRFIFVHNFRSNFVMGDF